MLEAVRGRGYKADGQICVSTDTRILPEGCIFFALKGANFNGNKFALQALEQGARLAVVDEPQIATDDRFILVDDTLKALQELAREWREEWAQTADSAFARKPVIGITGTNGKTTTKELTAAVLKTKYKVHYTQGNLNNQVGVPLTLLQLTSDHQIAIIEMGASHPGDIKELVEIAEPDYGLVTNVGKAHLQGFGSFEGVMKTKAELYDYLLEHDGQVVVNKDNPHLQQMLSCALQATPSYQNKFIEYQTGQMLQDTHLVGDYNSENIQAAICVGALFGVEQPNAIGAIKAYLPSNNRSQEVKTARNTLIVDAYNANPTSMRAAILSFRVQPTTQPLMFILGEMRELGECSHLEHQNIVNILLETKETDVLLVGKEFQQTTAPYPVFITTAELVEYLQKNIVNDKRILIKGSRANQLENIIQYL